MELYGVIGKPLEHSLSADYFTRKFASAGELDFREYRKIELESIDDLADYLTTHPELRGFNVTHPYKEAIIPLLSSLSEEAARIGAVNCVKVLSDGRLVGYNTDYEGFGMALCDMLQSSHPEALVLGTGGASKAVQAFLRDHNFSFKVISRGERGDMTYEQLTEEDMARHLLIINTTPLGMYPLVGECPPIPYECLGPDHYLFDLVYNPSVTEFLRRGQMQGSVVCNGQKMFVCQAEASWRFFGVSFGSFPPKSSSHSPHYAPCSLVKNSSK